MADVEFVTRGILSASLEADTAGDAGRFLLPICSGPSPLRLPSQPVPELLSSPNSRLCTALHASVEGSSVSSGPLLVDIGDFFVPEDTATAGASDVRGGDYGLF